jgi:hypothetical protein
MLIVGVSQEKNEAIPSHSRDLPVIFELVDACLVANGTQRLFHARLTSRTLCGLNALVVNPI